MKLKIYTIALALFLGLVISCADESLLPLPYNDRVTGAYLRIYSQRSNVFDLGTSAVGDLSNTSLAASGFEAIFEPVDPSGGDELASIDFYVSHRRGTDLTQEAFIKSVDASIFTDVAEPTYSEYKRGTVRVTAIEALTALRTIVTDPDGDGTDTNGNGQLGDDQCPKCVPLKGLAAFGAAGTLNPGDQVNIRWEMIMKDGRKISVANPQTTVNPAFANAATANSSPNVTTGQFYNSPFIAIMTVRRLISNSYVGTYSLRQRGIWSLNHTLLVHQESWPNYLSETLFPDQTVTLSIPAGGLSTEREFTVTYKGQTVTMRINFERTSPGLTGGAAAAIRRSLVPFGFPADTQDASTTFAGNIGTVFVALQNTTVDCTSERELYWVTPTAGTFGNGETATNPTASNFLSAKPLLPQNIIPNRGIYRNDLDGLTPGQTFTIGIDDDCDEYGRRNGYCTWTRRVYLSLTKI
jgi:hypothetical protein